MSGKEAQSQQGTLATVPNMLTLCRIILVGGLVGAFYLDGITARWIAFTIFTVASITDFLDGYLARAWGQQSALGQMLDPIADKLLVAASIVILVGWGSISGISLIPAVVILSREILVSGLREFLANAKISIPVTVMAKWKTGLQMVALGLLLLGPAGEAVLPQTQIIGLICLWAASIVTVYTGYDYFRSGLQYINAPASED